MTAKTFRGVAVPSIGLGTYKLRGEDCYRAVRQAIELGYRHIDTARVYENEAEVGRAIADSGVGEEEFFLASKVWRDHLDPKALEVELQTSLANLQVDVIDLYLLHWPHPDMDLRASLEALAEQKRKGLIRSFGVSNFPSKLFQKALQLAPILCNQVEYHPLLGQGKLLEVAEENNVMLTAYSPLRQGLWGEAKQTLEDIGRRHGKTASQVALKWLVDQGPVVPIPKATSRKHQLENLQLDDFELDDADRERIAKLPKDQRKVNPPGLSPEWDFS